jgi:hypothetical protein
MIETRCAVCRLSDGLVVNIIVAIPSDLPPIDCQLIEIMNEQLCDIGWYYDGTTFIDPNPQIEEPVPEDII